MSMSWSGFIWNRIGMTKHALKSFCVSKYKVVKVTGEIKKMNIHTITSIYYQVKNEKEWIVNKNLELVNFVAMILYMDFVCNKCS